MRGKSSVRIALSVFGLFLLALLLFNAGHFFIEWVDPVPTYEVGELIAVSRSPDWQYGVGFYTAVVSADPLSGGGLDIHGRVYVGDGHYFQDIELGRVDDFEEGVLRWGTIEWTESDLIIGDGDSSYMVRIPREEIERHR